MSHPAISAGEYVAKRNMILSRHSWGPLMHSHTPLYTRDFAYTPLSDSTTCIRILILKPGQLPDAINCKLVEIPLSSRPQNYTAISYWWGDPNDTRKIVCNGCSMEVTRSLYDALVAFRSHEFRQAYWADAICIDQTDDIEKSCQVRLMRRIYEKARGVSVWLGEQASHSDYVLNLAERFRDALHQVPVHSARDFRDPAIQTEFFRRLPQLQDPGWGSVGELLKRPWFGRMWIIQEIAVASEVTIFCGWSSTTWTAFGELVSFMLATGLADVHPDSNFERMNVLNMTRRNFQHRVREDLLSMLFRHRSAQATLGKDKIFALLGLSKLALRPDYSRTDEEVFLDAAVEMMRNDSNLDILTIPRASARARGETLPSWVPDWRQPSVGMAFISRFHATQAQPDALAFQAAGTPDGFTFSPQFSPDCKALVVQGIIWDGITKLSEPIQNIPQSQSISGLILNECRFYSTLVSWEKVAQARSQIPYITHETMLDAYLQTLLGGRIPHGLDYHRDVFQAFEKTWPRWWYIFHLPLPAPFLIRLCWASAMVWMLILRIKLGLFGWKNPSESRNRPMVEIQYFKNSMNNRRIIRTQQGYIGLSASSARLGDQVVLVRGSRVPLVLRRSGENSSWIFVGDTYVHGIMHGGAFDTSRCETLNIV